MDWFWATIYPSKNFIKIQSSGIRITIEIQELSKRILCVLL